MKKTFYFIMSVSLLMLFFSCDSEDADPIIINEEVGTIDLNVFYKDTMMNKYRPETNAKVYFYYGVYPFGFEYLGEGVLKNDKNVLYPDTLVYTNHEGNILFFVEEKYRKDGLSFLVESNYYTGWVNLSNYPYIRDNPKFTLYFN